PLPFALQTLLVVVDDDNVVFVGKTVWQEQVETLVVDHVVQAFHHGAQERPAGIEQGKDGTGGEQAGIDGYTPAAQQGLPERLRQPLEGVLDGHAAMLVPGNWRPDYMPLRPVHGRTRRLPSSPFATTPEPPCRFSRNSASKPPTSCPTYPRGTSAGACTVTPSGSKSTSPAPCMRNRAGSWISPTSRRW